MRRILDSDHCSFFLGCISSFTVPSDSLIKAQNKYTTRLSLLILPAATTVFRWPVKFCDLLFGFSEEWHEHIFSITLA